jgi:hypothetical protein
MTFLLPGIYTILSIGGRVPLHADEHLCVYRAKRPQLLRDQVWSSGKESFRWMLASVAEPDPGFDSHRAQTK